MTFLRIVSVLAFCHTCFALAGSGENKSPDSSYEKNKEFFLDKIFDKYGDEGVITFEGFEHLLDNLGLGGDLFHAPHELALHRVNGTFSQIHDVDHRHKRHTVLESVEVALENKTCLSPNDILKVYDIENQLGAVIKRSTFLSLCPALVYQLDQRSCNQVDALKKDNNNIYMNWLYAGLSVLLISATGLFGVAIMPVIHSAVFGQVLHFLVALAIGTLCGDALLHLLPHALIEEVTRENAPHDHTVPIMKCSVTLMSVLLFYSIETIMRIMTGGEDGHGHSHAMNKIDDKGRNKNNFELDAMISIPQTKTKEKMAPVVLMVLLGDGLHNLTDGLAIGAAFSNDPVTGFATALAVFCHELPHELGDFAVLLRSGMSIRKALYYNVISSILSFFGTAIGLWLAKDHVSSSQWIYAATAGTFLYIALADLVPEITSKGKPKLTDFFLAFFGILLGGIIMLSIALHEDSLVSIFD